MIDIANMSKFDRSKQKECLAKLLERLYGTVEKEKKYSWCRPPKYGEGYDKMIEAIKSVRGYEFINSNRIPLEFDFACESKKLLVEYDEKQHFTPQRRATFTVYQQIL